MRMNDSANDALRLKIGQMIGLRRLRITWLAIRTQRTTGFGFSGLGVVGRKSMRIKPDCRLPTKSRN